MIDKINDLMMILLGVTLLTVETIFAILIVMLSVRMLLIAVGRALGLWSWKHPWED